MTGKQSHQMDAAEVLETSAEIGLSGDEAKRRLVEHGPNELRVVRRVSPWRVFLEQFGWPLPLSAVQILYVNLATDGLPALALAIDPHDPHLMRRPPRDPGRGIFTRPVVTLMMVGGLWSALVNLNLFAWALRSGRNLDQAMTMVLLGLVLTEFFKAYNYRSDWQSVLSHPFANKWLNRAMAWELMLLVGVVYLSFSKGRCIRSDYH